jgi:hypothetical protein
MRKPKTYHLVCDCHDHVSSILLEVIQIRPTKLLLFHEQVQPQFRGLDRDKFCKTFFYQFTGMRNKIGGLLEEALVQT